MCGRIVQKSPPMEYVSQVFASEDLVFQDPAGPRYNIPPGTRPLALHRLGGAVDLDRQYWSWRPQGSKYRMNCARLDKVLAGSWPWKQLINRGRIVVPADGWYEWKQLEQAGKPGKQPFYIHRVDEGPLFFAGLSNWRAGAQRDEAHGFAIVTNDAAGGMVDVHDRRPVALPPSVAKQWLDPETSVGQALELLQHGLAETLFKWHAVKQAVGNSRYELPDAIHPI
ncbi:Gifsy-2 prophage protein [plant metagenome]|uniref:Gifsy-2 prophage protein n=1 Tax=plant metagenome TaxID=1297885 RepID=A0A484U219_9ZZZZ